MRYTDDIEDALLEQLEREPRREVILPDWAYWSGTDTCRITVDGVWISLQRHLYHIVIGDLPDWAGLRNPPTVNPRNVNPHLAIVVPRRGSRTHCPKGHRYSPRDFDTKRQSQVCGICSTTRQERREARAVRKPRDEWLPNVGDLNREKTHCPQGHPLDGDNLIKLRSGRRRCRTCHRETVARYRARLKEKE